MSNAFECPECRHRGARVVDSRPEYGRGSVRRKRECDACGARWHTLELCADRVDLLEDHLGASAKHLNTHHSSGRP